tara:strand:+ start:315 stop:443 length:129 start_codon:yes stop_codon:yes gene_type:complete
MINNLVEYGNAFLIIFEKKYNKTYYNTLKGNEIITFAQIFSA